MPEGIRETHLGISERAFRSLGPSAEPVRAAHHAIAALAYAAVGAGASAAGRTAAGALARSGAGGRRELSDGRAGARTVAVLQGLRGDALRDAESPLHAPASVRVDGRAVELARAPLRAAFPLAGDRLVIFLHGLMESEHDFSRGAGGPGQSYGARLQRELAASPVYVRFNSGLHISENGAEIAALLERLIEQWPVEVAQVALVGHSMGGLVARSAAHQGSLAGQRWPALVRHLVTLGTPHLGAPLEQGAHVLSAALGALPETRALARVLRRRSAGIRDLRHGSLVDEDWRGRDPDALRAAVHAEVPLLQGATHCFVSASVTRSAEHPLGRMIGDTLVLPASAHARGRKRSLTLDPGHTLHVGSAHHFALLNHPAVYERLRGWLRES